MCRSVCLSVCLPLFLSLSVCLSLSGFQKDDPKGLSENFDSGGPIVCRKPGADRWHLVGVIAAGDNFGEAKPLVLAEISKFIDWIRFQKFGCYKVGVVSSIQYPLSRSQARYSHRPFPLINAGLYLPAAIR